MKVYMLAHEYETDCGCDEVKIIGIYRTKEEAEAALQEVRNQPGFRDHQAGFECATYELGRTAWREGFVKMTGRD